jgi:hypothetical protein
MTSTGTENWKLLVQPAASGTLLGGDTYADLVSEVMLISNMDASV